MKRFAVFSGFLGSGKTTTMMALTQYYTEHHGKAAMISNDLGEGVTLADHRLALLSGVNASEITDECICFCHDVLTAHLNTFYDEGCELVLSDIPGFGVGALEHVYHGLSQGYPGQYDLAPFTVLIEPERAALLRDENNGGDLVHILRAQLKEADLIVLNKCDLLTEKETAAEKAWLRSRFPEAEVLAISAATGEGMEALSQALMKGRASMRHPDIDYDDANLGNAMDQLTEYYLQYHAEVCCNDFDGTEYLADMAGIIQTKLQAAGFDIPHMKLLAWSSEGDYGKVDLLGVERPLEVPHRFGQPCTEIAVILNANAACPASRLDEFISQTVREVSRQYQLEITVFKKECFNLGE